MILPDHEIERRCDPERYEHPLVSPFKRSNLQPASVDLTLGIDFLEPDAPGQEIDLSDIATTMAYKNLVCPTGYVLMPHAFVLGTTVEVIHIPNGLVGRLEGKSSLGRLGLTTHITAGFCDPGFSGRVTLELANFNHKAIKLRPGQCICQIAFEELLAPCQTPYGSLELQSKYQNQETTTGSHYIG